jgi:hypothetical protein
MIYSGFRRTEDLGSSVKVLIRREDDLLLAYFRVASEIPLSWLPLR